jgi:acetyl-CoA carboxylase carboxyl transferase subunit beta
MSEASRPRWFEQAPPEPRPRERREAPVTQLWVRCGACKAVLYKDQLAASHQVCPKCGHHMHITARGRLELLVDPGSFQRHDAGLAPQDPLEFADSKPYSERLTAAQAKTGERDAWLGGSASIEIGSFDFRLHGRHHGLGGRRVHHAAVRARGRPAGASRPS